MENSPLLTFSHGGYVWDLYQDSLGDLCIRRYDPSPSQWSDEEILIAGFAKEYSLALGNSDAIHLIAESSSGMLCYRFFDGDSWSGVTSLRPYRGGKISNLTLVSSERALHAAYLSQIDDLPCLVHQYLSHREWSAPRPIETMNRPFDKPVLQADNSGQCHLVVQETTGKTSLLNHYVFNALEKQWQHQNTVTEHEDSSGFEPCLLADRWGSLHLVWIRSDGVTFRVLYSRYQLGGWPMSWWSREQIISPPAVNAYSPILVFSGDDLLAIWQQIDGIYCNVSRDQGASWTEPRKMGELDDFVKLNHPAGDSFTSWGIDLIKTFSAKSPQLVVLAAYAYAMQSLGEPVDSCEDKEETTALTKVRETAALIPKEVQFTDSDSQFYAQMFSIEDIRLTNQQLGNTMRKQQEGLEQTNSQLEEIYKSLANLKREVELNRRLIGELRAEFTGTKEPVQNQEATVKGGSSKELPLPKATDKKDKSSKESFQYEQKSRLQHKRRLISKKIVKSKADEPKAAEKSGQTAHSIDGEVAKLEKEVGEIRTELGNLKEMLRVQRSLIESERAKNTKEPPGVITRIQKLLEKHKK